MEFPGFPSNDFDFHFAEVGAALAGLIVRDIHGVPLAGVLPSRPDLVSAGTGWTLRADPFVAVRTMGRAVLLGGANADVIVDVDPAPSANARIDVVYSLPADVSAGDPVQAVAVKTGLPGAVPAKPSIPDGAIELATFRVTAGQSSAAQGTLTNSFPFTAAAGGVIRARTKALLDAIDLMDGSVGYVLADKRFYVRQGSAWVDPGGKVLWSGTPVYLNGTQEANLSEPVAQQRNGIILVWQGYSGGSPVNGNWQYTHIPRSHPVGAGVTCALMYSNGTPIRKYVYVDAQKVRGHADNATAPATSLVLTRVISY